MIRRRAASSAASRFRRGSWHASRHRETAHPTEARASLSCAKYSWQRLEMRSRESAEAAGIFPSLAETLSAHSAAVGAPPPSPRVDLPPTELPNDTRDGILPASRGISADTFASTRVEPSLAPTTDGSGVDGASAEESHSFAESPSGIFAKPLAAGPNREEGGASEKVDMASSYPEVDPPPRSLRRSSSSRRSASASRSAAEEPFAADALPAATPLVYPMLAAWSTLRSSARPRLRMPSSAASSTRNICSEVNVASLVDARALRERGRKGRGSFIGMRPLRRELARGVDVMGRPRVSRAPGGAGGVGAHLIWSRRSSGSHREGVSETVEGASEGATLLCAPRAVRNVPEDEGAAVGGPEPRRTASQDVLSRAAYMAVNDPPPADRARRTTAPRDALEVAGRSGAPCTRPAQWQADAAPSESSHFVTRPERKRPAPAKSDRARALFEQCAETRGSRHKSERASTLPSEQTNPDLPRWCVSNPSSDSRGRRRRPRRAGPPRARSLSERS